jgi:hypothetical protein
MVPYQQQAEGYQIGASALQLMANPLMQHISQPQVMAHQHVAY